MTRGPASPILRTSRAMSLSSGAPLEQQGLTRRCDHPDCTTRLSRYNPDPTCARHGGWVAEAAPRRRRRTQTERADIDLPEMEGAER